MSIVESISSCEWFACSLFHIFVFVMARKISIRISRDHHLRAVRSAMRLSYGAPDTGMAQRPDFILEKIVRKESVKGAIEG